jgi:ribosomal-protein-alanine N-acetyltransferase
MKLTYRRMQELDVGRVHEIEQSLFQDPWPVIHFLNDINNNKQAYPYVLEFANELVGYSVCWYYAQEIHIGNIAVAKSYQGRGYGEFMLRKIINMFDDYICAYLEVRQNNRVAINLYRKFNFNILYRRYAYYTNGEDALIMVRYREQDNEE